MTLEVWLSPCRTRLVFRGPKWEADFPVGDLAKWRAFYVEMRDRNGPKGGGPGPFARFHQPVIDQLDAIARQIRQEARP